MLSGLKINSVYTDDNVENIEALQKEQEDETKHRNTHERSQNFKKLAGHIYGKNKGENIKKAAGEIRDRRYNKIEERKAEIIEDKKELREMNFNKAASKIQSKFRENELKKPLEAEESEQETEQEGIDAKPKMGRKTNIEREELHRFNIASLTPPQIDEGIKSINKQIKSYEMVMGDVNSQYTSVLERSAVLLKDNRLTPTGFTTSHPSYDTVKVSLDALSDPDFNKIAGVEGSGSDEVHFHVPIAGITSNINATARIIYQTLPPKFVAELFSFNSAPIDTFRNMFNAADKTPVIANADSLMNLQLVTFTGKQLNKKDDVKVFPSITVDGKINVNAYGSMEIKQIDVFNSNGKTVVSKGISNGSKTEILVLPDSPGVYIIRIRCNKNYVYRKVIKQ